jgi:hypothetical protein
MKIKTLLLLFSVAFFSSNLHAQIMKTTNDEQFNPAKKVVLKQPTSQRGLPLRMKNIPIVPNQTKVNSVQKKTTKLRQNESKKISLAGPFGPLHRQILQNNFKIYTQEKKSKKDSN